MLNKNRSSTVIALLYSLFATALLVFATEEYMVSLENQKILSEIAQKASYKMGYLDAKKQIIEKEQ